MPPFYRWSHEGALPRVSQPGSGLADRGHGSGPPTALTACASPQLFHACHGPGLSVLCFVRHDTLEYFSVYGTALSMWVSLMGEWPPRSPAPPGPIPRHPPAHRLCSPPSF